ncbi:membrane protein [Clostridium botulinum C/D str. DC5]|uniref:Membrane protein n=1 Tax=Clostridium botulinum C/D str. DC5 TaxID=1443128 RepID=A0A0A0I048_CLOBO|nr:CBS domain-containing protein [Clostridium botulinum]KGM94789.1 membrane protein [Clostridium botulinum C/D str. DC5]
MNVAFFLTPKKDVVYETINSTMRQALERMEYHRYTAIPIIDEEGKYVGTITEGDMLWKLKNTPLHVSSDIEDLISLAVNQNFVPVVDDNDVFIGIIKRSEIIQYYYNKSLKVSE